MEALRQYPVLLRRQIYPRKLFMRQLIALGIALSVIVVASGNVEAGKKKTAKPCPHCGRYHTVQSYGYRPAKKKKLLGRLWELEQRKNAWLMRTFLGR